MKRPTAPLLFLLTLSCALALSACSTTGFDDYGDEAPEPAPDEPAASAGDFMDRYEANQREAARQRQSWSDDHYEQSYR